MKQYKTFILFVVMIACLFAISSVIAAELPMQSGSVRIKKSITADPAPSDNFTRSQLFDGRFNLSISGTWTGTVYLQRSFDNSVWVDVTSWTSNVETTINDPQIGGLYYRIGVKSGGWGSGTIVLRLTK